MSTQLTLGSLFDGIGGFMLASEKAGIKPIWASEIEPFPILVTSTHFPDVEHLGDVHQINGGDIEPTDIVAFGSPCQDVSISSPTRTGLAGARSSLFFEAIRVIKEMREKTNGKQPRWIVFENVVGLMSSNMHFDYRQVLESFVQIKDPEADVPMPGKGKWLTAGEILGDDYSLAWRVIDASKGWGVAQRRRRVFVVVDLNGHRASQVLFESEGLSGYTPPRNEAWERTAEGAQNGTGASSSGEVIGFEPGAAQRLGGHAWEDSIGTLRAHMGDNQAAVAIEFNPSDSRIKIKEDGICQTLCARIGTGGNNAPLTMKIARDNDQGDFMPIPFGISPDQSKGMLSDNPHAGIYEAATSRTLDCSGSDARSHQGGMLVVEPVQEKIPSYCMTVGNFGVVATEEAPTLMARDFKDPPVIGKPMEDQREYLVRRLTTGECALLQGYEHDWCENLAIADLSQEDIARWIGIFEAWRKTMGRTGRPYTEKRITKWLKNPYSDSAAYKAFGNSICVPCVHFILAGIVWAASCDE